MLPETFRKCRTKDELESENMLLDPRLGSSPVVFGFIHDQWMKLVNQMQPGDELWEYSSKKEDWDELIGESGIALVRNGKTIDTIVTRMN
jgi:hypothetical protein